MNRASEWRLTIGRPPPTQSSAPLPHLLKQANPRRNPHIERLHPPRHRNLHPLRRQRGDGGGQALPFRAEQPGHRAAEVEGVEVDGVAQVGGEDVAFEALQRFACCDVFEDAQAEVGAHRGAQHAGGPGLGAAGGEEDVGDADGGGGAQDGAEVAGVLHAVEQHAVAGEGPNGGARGGRGRHGDHGERAAGRVDGADVGEQAVGEFDEALWVAAGEQRGDLGLGAAAFAGHHQPGLPAALQRDAQQVGAVEEGFAAQAPLPRRGGEGVELLDGGVVAGGDALHAGARKLDGEAEAGQGHHEGAEQQVGGDALADLIEGLGALGPAFKGHRLLQRLPGAEPDAGKDGGHHQADARHGVPGQRGLGKTHRQQHRKAGAKDGRQGQPHDGEEARQHPVPQGQPLGRRQRERGRAQAEVGEAHAAHPHDDAGQMHEEHEVVQGHRVSSSVHRGGLAMMSRTGPKLVR